MKIFAILDLAGRDLNLMFDPELRDFYFEPAPHAFTAVPGGWGRNGATRCELAVVDEATLFSRLLRRRNQSPNGDCSNQPLQAKQVIKAPKPILLNVTFAAKS